MAPVEVVIVGAGPTGLAAANLLGKVGVNTLLLERNAGLSDYPRAISIDDEGLRICQATGLREALLPDILAGIDVYYIAGGHFLARVSPSSQPNGYPLISTFHQPTFEATLLQGLARFPCVQVLFQHSLETFEQHERGVSLTIRTADGMLCEVECAYLLACDGAKSSIRQALNIPMSPLSLRDLWGYKKEKIASSQKPETQRWLVIDTINDTDPAKAAIFFCNPSRPAVTIPAPHGHRRWEFMLLAGEDPQALLQTETGRALITQARQSIPSQPHNEQQEGSDQPEITRQAVYTFHATLAQQFSRGRVFLLGDAAHLMPPFGGQGMNSGLRDAHNLCWKLQMVLKGKASPNLLATYQQERAPHVARMILFSTLLGKIIMPTNRLMAFLRNLFFRGIGRFPPLRTLLTEAQVKPTSKYRHGGLLSSHGKGSKHLIGTLLPQAYVTTPDGTRTLLDEVLGDGFSLVRLYEDPETAFALWEESEIWEQLGVRWVCVQTGMDDAHDKSAPALHLPPAARPVNRPLFPSEFRGQQLMTVKDNEQQISMFLCHNRELILLVRPDRYIMGVFHAGRAESFKNNKNMLYSLIGEAVALMRK